MAHRLHAMGASGYEQGFALSLHPERLLQPLKRKKPTTYFVNSMSDLFHEDIPDNFLDQVMDVIRQTPQHGLFPTEWQQCFGVDDPAVQQALETLRTHTQPRGDVFDIGQSAPAKTKDDIIIDLVRNPKKLAGMLNLTEEQAKNVRSLIIGGGTGGIHRVLSQHLGDELSAVLGALALFRPRTVVWAMGVPMYVIVAFAIWAAMDLLGMFQPDGVAHASHLAGMAYGGAYGLFLRRERPSPRKKDAKEREGDLPSEEDLDRWEREWMVRESGWKQYKPMLSIRFQTRCSR